MRTAAVVGLLGVWLIGAPFLSLSIDGRFLTDLLVGIVVMNAGVMMASGEGWVRYLTTGVGIWVCISSFIPRLLADGGMSRNDVIAGALLVVAGLGALNYGWHHPEPLDPNIAL